MFKREILTMGLLAEIQPSPQHSYVMNVVQKNSGHSEVALRA